MIKIKKYKNRKLYNTDIGAYLNFSGLQDMIENNVEFVIIDAKTRNDITPSVLTEMLCQSLKSQRYSPSVQALKSALKSSSMIDINGQLSFNFT
jgi:polyhydroxyalkanoate synthesis repressor PhaR